MVMSYIVLNFKPRHNTDTCKTGYVMEQVAKTYLDSGNG